MSRPLRQSTGPNWYPWIVEAQKIRQKRFVLDGEAVLRHLRFSTKHAKVRARYAMTIDRNEMNFRLVQLSESPNIRFWRADYDQLSFAERVFGFGNLKAK
jgi:hypothetical protein